MFATDFVFNGKRASDFDLVIGTFDGEIGTASGGEIEFTVVKTPSRDKHDFYGAEFNSVLVWNFSIIKSPCMGNNNRYFDQYEERQVANWLLRQDGYKWFQFDQEGYEDIYYNVQVNMSPHQISGKTVGFDIIVTSDCGYGYSQEFHNTYVLNANNPITINISSDINSYILPHIILNGNGNFYISNNSDLSQNISNEKPTELSNITGTITMDSDNEIITGISSPNDFNWYFLRLVNGVNEITTNSDGDIELEITYREPRRVII